MSPLTPSLPPLPGTAVTGTAAGVPFLAVPPDNDRDIEAPVVLAWHLMDAPRTESAFAAALPMSGLRAWRIYLGLPLSGSRLPAGGTAEIQRLGAEDAVGNLFGPVTEQAVTETGPALVELRRRFPLAPGSVGLVGGSHGAAVAAQVAITGELEVAALALVSPVTRLRPVVDAVAGSYGMTYPWGDGSLAIADRLDVVARVGELADRGEPAILLVVGEDDSPAVREPATQLRDALRGRYADPARAELVIIPGMAHALAEEPGTQPAAQTPHAAVVDGHVVRWLDRHWSHDV